MAIIVKDISTLVGIQRLSNPSFTSDTVWTHPPGSGWTISGGNAVATAATGNLTQTGVLTSILHRAIITDIVATVGKVVAVCGSQAGSARGTGTFTEDITANGTDFYFRPATFAEGGDASGTFTGTIGRVDIYRMVETFTVADFGTVKAASFDVVVSGAAGSGGLGASICAGLADGTRQLCALGASEHGQETSDSYHYMSGVYAIALLNSEDGTFYGAGTVAFIADGVQITWSTTYGPVRERLASIRLYGDGGSGDLNVHVGTFTSPALLEGTTVVTAPGFKPDSLKVVSCLSSTAIDTSGNAMRFSVGYANDTGSAIISVSYNFMSLDNQAIPTVYGWAASNEIGHAPSSPASEFTIQSFDATGFTVEALANGSSVCAYLALKFNGKASHWAGIVNAPTSTGDKSFTDPGFTPQAWEWCLTGSTVVDANDNGIMGYFCVGKFDGTTERTVAIRDNSAGTVTSTGNRVEDVAAMLYAGDGTIPYRGTFVSFDANGCTLNFSVAGATAKKWPTFVIGTPVSDFVPRVMLI